MTIKIDVTTDLLSSLAHKAESELNTWQKRWYGQRYARNRNLHKGRQIGADYYFTLEALQDACLTGRNKIFIEASTEDNFISSGLQMMQSHTKLTETMSTASIEECHIQLSNGASIYFFTDDKIGWSGISGDVYLSEWAFHSNPYQSLRIAEGITCHDKWRRTAYSSRASNDNGQLVERRIIKDGQMFNESAYFDVVPSSIGYSRYFAALRERYTEQVFNELYLCQHPSY